MHITLLILFFICHWAADFTHLSMPYMLEAKKIGKPLGPIYTHAMVHAVLMTVVIIFYGFAYGVPDMHSWVYYFWLQLISHFLIDTLKGKLNVWVPSVANPANKIYWYVFGLDQLLHTLVIILMWYLIILR